MVPFWQTLRPLRKVGKLRKVIEVPTFSADCGPVDNSINIQGDRYVVDTGDLAQTYLSNLTIECWVKLSAWGDNLQERTIFQQNKVPGGPDPQFRFFVIGGVPSFSYNIGGVLHTEEWDDRIPTGEWVHLAITFTTTQVRLYVNGVFQDVHTNSGGALDASTGESVIGNDNNAGVTAWQGNIDELRIWNVTRTADEILFDYQTIILPTTSNLLAYFRFSEGTGPVTENLVTGTDWGLGPVDDFWDEGVGFPNRFGASFIAGIFEIATEDEKSFSLKFPVNKPYLNINFALCVSYLDEDTNETIRYQLWHVDGEDLFSDIPDYNGEILPSGAKLEIWNIDGNPTVDLTTAITIETSILRTVTTVTDVSETSALSSELAIDTTLAAEFPLTPFPLVFNTQQTY